MNSADLTQDMINELKQYLKINEDGYLITIKLNKKKMKIKNHKLKQFRNTEYKMGGSRSKIGERRGFKSDYGYCVHFTFNNGQKLSCKARDIIWCFFNGPIPEGYKVAPIDSDFFNDRIENLRLTQNKNGRPRGSKDKEKRRSNPYGLTKSQKEQIKKLYLSGLGATEISKEANISPTAIRKIKKSMKPDFVVSKHLEVTQSSNISGVYIIGFFGNGRSKFYIGSSINIGKRLGRHYLELNDGTHHNKPMQQIWNTGGIRYKAYLLEECSHKKLLEREQEYLHKYCPGCLLNTDIMPEDATLEPFFNNIIHRINNKEYVVEKGCWLWKNIKRKYGRSIQSTINGVTKFITPHRLSFFKEYGYIPKLVRHLCDNKNCINPEHLKEGSHHANSIDYYRDSNEEFEKLWIKYEGDIQSILTEWPYNASSVYYRQNKLKLKEKYPEIAEKTKKKRKQKNPSNSRGPKRHIFKGQQIDSWICIEPWTAINSHKWECSKCGRIRQTSKYCLKKHPRCPSCHS